MADPIPAPSDPQRVLAKALTDDVVLNTERAAYVARDTVIKKTGDWVIANRAAADAGRAVLVEALSALAAPRCVCHSGSVCGPACEAGRHHDGCALAAHPRDDGRLLALRLWRTESSRAYGVRQLRFGQRDET